MSDEIEDLGKEGTGNFFMAVIMTAFAFCFVFLGSRLSNLYFFVGFVFLIVSIFYWVKFDNCIKRPDRLKRLQGFE